jgi:hypothetical protein
MGALAQALMILSYYTMDTNRVLVLEGRRWMEEALADHAPAIKPPAGD